MVVAELNAGRHFERAGDLIRAEEIYRGILDRNTSFPEAWFRLGVVCLKQRKLPEAVGSFQKALDLDQKSADAWNLLGVALGSQGDAPKAEAAFRQSLRVNPNFGDAHVNLAKALIDMSRQAEALTILRRAIELDPTHVVALKHLAHVYAMLGQLDAAIACLRRILEIQPQDAIALKSLVGLLSHQKSANPSTSSAQRSGSDMPVAGELQLGLGLMLFQQGNFAEAIDAFRESIALGADSAVPHVGLGNCLLRLGRSQEAEASFGNALAIDLGNADAHYNLGVLLAGDGRCDAALDHFRLALEREPTSADAFAGMANVYASQRKYSDAEDCLRQAESLAPESATPYHAWADLYARRGNLSESLRYKQMAFERDADNAENHYSLAVTCLTRGDWDTGWREYEWRWHRGERKPRQFRQDLWNGDSFPNQTLLLHCEQGLGDTIQFCRFARLAKSFGGRVILECQRTLIPLLRSCEGIDELVAAGDTLPPFDLHAPLMSLPRILCIRPTTVPTLDHYLSADSTLERHWGNELSGDRDFKIGIAWRGNPANGCDELRSTRLAYFEPLAKISGVRLYSLQKWMGSDEIASAADRFQVVDLGSRLDLNDGAFLDTAAVMKNLDLVISICSSPAHLAGAIGVPVWLALAYVADWRWLLDRDDTPWYPTMRLFRQKAPGDWESVFESMRCALLEMVCNRAAKSPDECESQPVIVE